MQVGYSSLLIPSQDTMGGSIGADDSDRSALNATTKKDIRKDIGNGNDGKLPPCESYHCEYNCSRWKRPVKKT